MSPFELMCWPRVPAGRSRRRPPTGARRSLACSPGSWPSDPHGRPRRVSSAGGRRGAGDRGSAVSGTVGSFSTGCEKVLEKGDCASRRYARSLIEWGTAPAPRAPCRSSRAVSPASRCRSTSRARIRTPRRGLHGHDHVVGHAGPRGRWRNLVHDGHGGRRAVARRDPARLVRDPGRSVLGSGGDVLDENPFGAPGDFSASITWGGEGTSPGSIVELPGGGFEVTGAHSYAAAAASSPVTVVITDHGGMSTTVSGTIVVHEAPAAGISVLPVSVTEGTAFSGRVATFSDQNPAARAGDFAATIDWGDGSRASGAVSTSPSGGFQVVAGHTYQHAGSYTITVTVSDAGGTSPPARGTAVVNDAPLTGFSAQVTALQDVPFLGSVATFRDENPFGVAGEFTATIDWGDGTSTGGIVTAAPGGGFQVAGNHTFAGIGTQTITVQVGDHQGSSTTIQDVIQIGSPPAPRSTILIMPTSPTGHHGWYTQGVQVTVSANGLGAPVTATRCELDPPGAPAVFDALPGACPFAGPGQTSPRTERTRSMRRASTPPASRSAPCLGRSRSTRPPRPSTRRRVDVRPRRIGRAGRGERHRSDVRSGELDGVRTSQRGLDRSQDSEAEGL